MLQKLIDGFINLLSRTPKFRWAIQLLAFLLIILPVVSFAIFSYVRDNERLTEAVVSRREAIAYLAAVNLKDQFDRLGDIGVSLATRVQFRKLVEEEDWEAAIKILEKVPADFPFIERVFLADTTGVLMADTPALPGVRGKNFSFRDWYQGVISTQKPYLSELYKRTAEPQYNVIAIATPIKSDDNSLLGILVMQIRLETVFEWSREIEVGSSGFVYFTDRKGQVAAHPNFPSQGEIVDFSSVPSVAKALAGEHGVEVNYNPIEKEERLSAFYQVPNYGWAVVVQQPTAAAFVLREAQLRQDILISGIVVAVITLLIYFTLRSLFTLFQYRQREKVLLESVGDGLIAIDRYWHITLWNKASSLLTGFSQEEALGRPFKEIVKFIGEDKSENIVFIEEAMLYGKTYTMKDNTKLIKKDGSEIDVGDSASPIFDEGGKVVGAIIVFRDISHERELQKAREEFASLAAHQLRGPVTVIKGYTSMLVEEGAGKNKEWGGYLEDMQKAVDRLDSLVNALLNVSRLEVGTLAINPEPANVADIADEVIRGLAPRINEKKLTLDKNYAKGLPSISVDVKLMQAVLQNLFSNAVKYTPEGGKISIGIEKENSSLLIKIADTGYGIPKDEQAKIFTKFFRASNSAKTVTEGSGLGLYIVKTIIGQVGGRIWFESEVDKGSTFFVSLPIEGMKKREGTKGLS